MDFLGINAALEEIDGILEAGTDAAASAGGTIGSIAAAGALAVQGQMGNVYAARRTARQVQAASAYILQTESEDAQESGNVELAARLKAEALQIRSSVVPDQCGDDDTSVFTEDVSTDDVSVDTDVMTDVMSWSTRVVVFTIGARACAFAFVCACACACACGVCV